MYFTCYTKNRKTKIEERKVDGHADYIWEARGLEPMPMTGKKPGIPYLFLFPVDIYLIGSFLPLTF
jgi:hypothetical protein